MKYLIFFLSYIFSSLLYAADCSYRLENSPGSYPTMEALCAAKYDSTSKPFKDSSGTYRCSITNQPISVPTGCEPTMCATGLTPFLDGYITSLTGSPPDTVCHEKCIYVRDGGGTAFDTPNGNLSWGFNATSNGQSCSVDTPKGNDTPSGGGDTGGGDTGGGDTGGGDTGGGNTGGGNTGGGTGSDLEIISAIRSQGQAIKDAIYTTGSAATANYYEFKNALFDRLSGISDYINGIFNRQDDTNKILKSIESKMSSDTSPEITDKLTETNSFLSNLIDSLVDATELLTNIFSTEGSELYDGLGSESSDSRYTQQLADSKSLFSKLTSLLNFTDRQGLQDLTVETGIYGAVKIPLSEWTPLLALLKLFLHLYVLMLCIRMIQRTISEI